ncbi:MAG: N-acetylglucosamine kinase [Brevefilum sp.]
MTNINAQQRFLLGVDVGSSKTHALIADARGNALGLGEAGCGNYEVVGLDGFIYAMQAAVQNACDNAHIESEQILAMGFGIAGYDWPSEEPLMVQAIEALGINCPYRFVNDAVIGLFAGAKEGWGIAVDAGAGNNIRGLDQKGRIGRITGNSAWFGEIGGGGEMVWLAQVAVTHAWTLRGPQTRLTQALIELTRVETEFALIEGLAMERIDLPSTFAKDIFRIAQEGDRVAREIVITSAQELAQNVNAVIQQLGLQKQAFDVVLIGSIFKAGEMYIEPFRQVIQSFASQAHLVQLSVPPVVGSALLAAETAGINPAEIRDTLITSLSVLMNVEEPNFKLT